MRSNLLNFAAFNLLSSSQKPGYGSRGEPNAEPFSKPEVKTACLPFLALKSLPVCLFLLFIQSKVCLSAFSYFSLSQKSACLPFLTFNSVKSLPVCLFLHFIQSKVCMSAFSCFSFIQKSACLPFLTFH